MAKRAVKTKEKEIAEVLAATPAHAPFMKARQAPVWRQLAEEGNVTKTAKEMNLGARMALKRRASREGFWHPAGRSRTEEERDVKIKERDRYLSEGHAIPAPWQDGEELTRQGYWISPGFVLTTQKLDEKTKRKKVKRRMCVNMKRANARNRKRTYKNDKLEEMGEMIGPDCYAISWDIEGAFQHVGIHPGHCRYFVVDFGPDVPGTRFIMMLCLPFGFCNSPEIWGRVMKTATTAMRSAGIPTIVYVDDGLNLAPCHHTALQMRPKVEKILSDHGLRRALDKGCWEPTQRLDNHLGTRVLMDRPRGEFRTPVHTCQTIKQKAHALLSSAARHSRLVGAAWLASFAGLVLSTRRSVTCARFFTRDFFDDMTRAGVYRSGDYGRRVRLSRKSLEALRWWAKIRSSAEISRSIWRPATDVIWATDSSDKAWGLLRNAKPLDQYRVDEYAGEPTMRIWNEKELGMHITHKELRAFRNALRENGVHIQGKVLRLLEDNMGVVGILTNYVTKSQAMRDDLAEIIDLLQLYDIWLKVRYCNTKLMPADWLTRGANKGDWRLAPQIVQQHIHQWGLCTIDRFADNVNAQLPRFNAAFPCLGSEAMDAFTEDWSHERNYINPPWGLLGKVLSKLRSTPAAEAVLIIPHWPSATWWPLLTSLADEYIVLHDRRHEELTLPDSAFQGGDILQQTGGVPEPLRNRGWRLWVVHVPARPPP